MTRQPPPNATTWTAVALIALGLIMIFLGWNGAAGEVAAQDLRAQFPYLLSGGLFGLSLVGAGLVLVRVYEGRRDTREVVRHLQELTQAVERLAATMPAATYDPAPSGLVPPMPAPAAYPPSVRPLRAPAPPAGGDLFEPAR